MLKKNGFRVGLMLVIGLLVLRAVIGYRSTYQYSTAKRAEIAAQNASEIHIAVVGNLWQDSSFVDGVTKAVEEVDADGIRLGSGDDAVSSRLVIHRYDDSTVENARASRLSIASDHRIIAVLGHSTSDTAIPASITYEYNGILFISTFATDALLTNHGFMYTFSTIPAESAFIDMLVRFALQKKWYKLAVLHARNSYGLEFYERLGAQLEKPLEIVRVKSFFTGDHDYKSIIYDVMKTEFDAVVIAARDHNAARMIKQVREMGIDKPILGAEGLDNVHIWAWSDQKAYDTYVASTYVDQTNLVGPVQPTDALVGGYTSNQGYEAVKILVDILRKSGSAKPIELASTLKYNYAPGYGGYFFDVNGLIANKKIFMKQFEDGKFAILKQE